MSAKDLDTWPERIALPMLKQSLKEIEFVAAGLSALQPGQAQAATKLNHAHGAITAAIAYLEGR